MSESNRKPARKKKVCCWRKYPIFDCVGHIVALHDDQIEVVLEIPRGKRVKRSFNRSRFEKLGLNFEGAIFRYQIFKERNGEVQSRLIHRTNSHKKQIPYDTSVFEQFDSSKKD